MNYLKLSLGRCGRKVSVLSPIVLTGRVWSIPQGAAVLFRVVPVRAVQYVHWLSLPDRHEAERLSLDHLELLLPVPISGQRRPVTRHVPLTAENAGPIL